MSKLLLGEHFEFQKYCALRMLEIIKVHKQIH
jgi:hypothetical protein